MQEVLKPPPIGHGQIQEAEVVSEKTDDNTMEAGCSSA
jgi:hypothetical protein